MQRQAPNPDWFFALEEPPEGWLPGDFGRYRRLRPDEMRARGIDCLCAEFVACCCGAYEAAGCTRVRLSRIERLERARASPASQRPSVVSLKFVKEIKLCGTAPHPSFPRVCFVWRARNPGFRDPSRGSHARG